jgi:hypothetical protein
MPSSRLPGSHGSPYTGSTSPKALTSERIAADIAAFNQAGGHIEVLGNTPFHRKSPETEAPAGPSAATTAPQPEEK